MTTLPWRLQSADPLIRQHRVQGDPVVPFALWLVKARDAVIALQSPPREFREVVVHEMTRLRTDEPIDVTFTAFPDSGGGRFEVRRGDVVLVEGAWSNGLGGTDIPVGLGGTDIPVCPRSAALADQPGFYATAEAAGLAYGPALRRLSNLRTDGQAWSADLTSPEPGLDAAAATVSAWDALLQPATILPVAPIARVPFRIEHIRFLGDGPLRKATGSSRPGSSAGRRIADVRGFADADAPVIELLGVHYAPLPTVDAAPVEGTLETGGAKRILENLRAAPIDRRAALLSRFLEEQLLDILNWKESRRGDLARGFVEVGLDSLMAVDLQFRLQTSLKFALKPGQTMNKPTIAALADFLLQKHVRLD